MAIFMLQQQSWIVVTETDPQSQKDLLSVPLQKKFADLSSRTSKGTVKEAIGYVIVKKYVMKIKLCHLLEKWACLSVKWGNACCSGHSLLLKSCGPKLSPALLLQFCWDWFLLKKGTPLLIPHFSRNIPHKCISLESCWKLKLTQIIFWAKKTHRDYHVCSQT